MREKEESYLGMRPPGGPLARLAHIISEITNPLLVALPTFLVIAIWTAPNVLRGLLWWVVTAIGVSLAPLFFVVRGVRVGRYSDHHVSLKEQRFIPLLFGIVCVSVAFVLLLILQASRPLIATMTAVLVVLSIAIGITRRWKISLHLVGVTGAVTACTLLFGPAF